MLKTKRVYDAPTKDDGFRVLVDRLWPRGLTKEKARVDRWMKNVAPSNELRRWFHHESPKWDEFREKYEDELDGNAALEELRTVVREKGNVTLLYGAKDARHNQAVVLRDLLSRDY